MLSAILRNAGIRTQSLARACAGWGRYVADRRRFRAMAGADLLPWGRELPILTEWDEPSAGLGAYFFQDLLAARWVLASMPERHVDVGSRIDGFIAHLAVHRPVEVIDIRPLPLPVPNVTFHQLNLMDDLPDAWIGCTDSLSCLHTIEHFGLGRYGDPIDPQGHLKGLAQLKRMVRPGGHLLLSTPVGRERVEFNAHRVLSPATIMSWFADGWTITRSAVIDDANAITESPGAITLEQSCCDTGVGMVFAAKSA